MMNALCIYNEFHASVHIIKQHLHCYYYQYYTCNVMALDVHTVCLENENVAMYNYTGRYW